MNRDGLLTRSRSNSVEYEPWRSLEIATLIVPAQRVKSRCRQPSGIRTVRTGPAVLAAYRIRISGQQLSTVPNKSGGPSASPVLQQRNADHGTGSGHRGSSSRNCCEGFTRSVTGWRHSRPQRCTRQRSRNQRFNHYQGYNSQCRGLLSHPRDAGQSFTHVPRGFRPWPSLNLQPSIPKIGDCTHRGSFQS